MNGNGNKLPILNIGSSFLDTSHDSHNKLNMRVVLHVPTIAKNLLSVAQFSKENDVFFEFHTTFLLREGSSYSDGTTMGHS